MPNESGKLMSILTTTMKKEIVTMKAMFGTLTQWQSIARGKSSVFVVLVSVLIVHSPTFAATSYINYLLPVDYVDDDGDPQQYDALATKYTPGDTDYCSHTTSEDEGENEIEHAHAIGTFGTMTDPDNNDEAVTSAKAKEHDDTITYPSYTYVGPGPTTAGNCHSYATDNMSIWLWSSDDGAEKVLKDDFTIVGSEASPSHSPSVDSVVAVLANDWGGGKTPHHSIKVEVYTEVECGVTVAKGISCIREKSNSSGIYKKTYSPPLVTNLYNYFEEK
jgi:hypothetical protein